MVVVTGLGSAAATGGGRRRGGDGADRGVEALVAHAHLLIDRRRLPCSGIDGRGSTPACPSGCKVENEGQNASAKPVRPLSRPAARSRAGKPRMSLDSPAAREGGGGVYTWTSIEPDAPGRPNLWLHALGRHGGAVWECRKDVPPPGKPAHGGSVVPGQSVIARGKEEAVAADHDRSSLNRQAPDALGVGPSPLNEGTGHRISTNLLGFFS